MAGRRAKPLDFHLIDGRKHFTKKELEERIQSKIAIGNNELEEPDFVTIDKVAHKKWMECKKIYEANKDFNLVSSADSGFLGKYCCTFSEYLHLLELRRVVAVDSHFDLLKEEMALLKDDENRGLYKKLSYLLSVDGVMEIDNSINKKLTALTQMEDRLFLNPQSRIKTSLPKGKKAPQTAIEAAGFDL